MRGGSTPMSATGCSEEFDTMALRTLEGQATELGWRHDNVPELSPEDYLHLDHAQDVLVHDDPSAPGRRDPRLGRAGHLGALTRFGFYLGAAFQIRDDLLNLDDQAVYGKERNGDLFEAKRSLVLIHLCGRVQGDDEQQVRHYLSVARSERTSAMVAGIRALIDTYGSIEFATEYAGGIAGAALEAHEEAFDGAPGSEDATFVRDLVPYMLGRTS